MRVFIRVMAIFSIVLSAIWLYFDFNFEPSVALIGSIITLVSTFIFPRNNENEVAANSNEKDEPFERIENGPKVTYRDNATHNGDNNF
jgi:hypothetical protein